MDFANEHVGDVLVVKMSGRLDSSTAQAAEEHLAGVIGKHSPHLALDMAQVDYISSAGLRVLLVVAKKLQQAKGKMVLFGLVPNVREVFSISGFDKIFTIETDQTTALASVI